MSAEELIFEVAYVCREGKAAPTSEDVHQALTQVDGLLAPPRSARERVYKYRNPETQVDFDFVVYAPEGDLAGLAFEMALPRPNFFALEALPAVVQVARELHCDVEIVSPDNDMPICDPSLELMLDQWQRANRDETAILETEGEVRPSLPGHCLESLWEYMLLRPEMARRYNRNRVSVPPLELLRHRETGELARAVRWRGLGPAALGDCELVVLEEPPKPLRHESVIQFSDLRKVAKFAFRDIAQPVIHRLFDKSKVLADLVQVLESVEVTRLEDYQVVPYRQALDSDLTPLLES